MYSSQITNCICLKLQNIFVSNCKIYLSQIAKCICLRLKVVFVSRLSSNSKRGLAGAIPHLSATML